MDDRVNDWEYTERELQVLELFAKGRRHLRMLAASRCPHDQRLLGAVCQLPDGLWAWHAGGRLSPKASRGEVRSWYLDLLDSDELTQEIYRWADELADEHLSASRRYETPPTVVKIHAEGPQGGLRVGPWRGQVHALQAFANGLPLFQPTACRCRREYAVQMLALAYAGVRTAGRAVRGSIHLTALPTSPARRLTDQPGFAYSFTQHGLRLTFDDEA